MSDTPTKAWICPVCGYIHYGDEPPDECPICGTEKALFEPYAEPASTAPAAQPAETGALKVVIIGAGIAGVSAAEAVRGASPQAEVLLISNESRPPYYRLNLTRFLAGEVSAGQLPLHPEEWYAEQDIQLRLNVELAAIDLAQKTVSLCDGSQVRYDKLIYTLGARPFVPPIAGAQRQNVHTLRRQEDAETILESCQPGTQVVCIGGGLLGLETVGALSRRGATVTVLENQAWLLPRQLNQKAGQAFLAQVRGQGISVLTGARVRELTGTDAVDGVLLEGGTCIPAELVVISAGVRAIAEPARQAGLEVKQGVVVDRAMRTSDPAVFAAGDAAEFGGMLYGTWGPAQIQGTVAGLNAAGQDAEFHGIPRSNTLKVLGTPLFSIGRVTPEGELDRVLEGEINGNYFCFVFRDQKMAGGILMGDTSLSAQVKKLVEDGADCSTLLAHGARGESILRVLSQAG